jgi:hypothetical protein
MIAKAGGDKKSKYHDGTLIPLTDIVPSKDYACRCYKLGRSHAACVKQLAVMLGMRIQEGQKAGLIETRGKPEKMSDRLTLLDIVPTRDYASRCYKLGRSHAADRRTCDLRGGDTRG